MIFDGFPIYFYFTNVTKQPQLRIVVDQININGLMRYRADLLGNLVITLREVISDES